MKKTSLVVMALWFIIQTTHAQRLELSQSTFSNINPATGISQSNPFGKFRFRKEGHLRSRKTGNFGGKIKPYIESEPEALKQLNRYKTKRIMAVGFGAAALASMTAFIVNNVKDDELRPPEESGPIDTHLFQAAVAFVAMQYIMGWMSNGNMRKAVKKFNEAQSRKVGINVGVNRFRNHRIATGYYIHSGIRIKL
ncbi:MAG: hypothetical protein AAF551_13325 [Bacteroidota bacterium]